MQPYVIESCGFQQNAPKEILYVKVRWLKLQTFASSFFLMTHAKNY